MSGRLKRKGTRLAICWESRQPSMRVLRSVGEGHAGDALAYFSREPRNGLTCRSRKPSSAFVGFGRGGHTNSRRTEQPIMMHITRFDHLDYRFGWSVFVGN